MQSPTGRGRTDYTVTDPNTGQLVGRIPISPSGGKWKINPEADQALRAHREPGAQRQTRGGGAISELPEPTHGSIAT